MNVTVAAPPNPTALLIVSAVETSAVTAPTEPVLGEVAPVSTDTMAGASSPLESAGSALDDILKPDGVAARAAPRLSPDRVTTTTVDAGV